MITGSFLAYGKETETSAFNTIFNRLPRYAPSEVRTYDDFGLKVGDFFVIDSVKSIVMHKIITPEGVILRSTGGKERIKPSAIFGDGITQSELDRAKVSIDTQNYGLVVSNGGYSSTLTQQGLLVADTSGDADTGSSLTANATTGLSWVNNDNKKKMSIGIDRSNAPSYIHGLFGYSYDLD